MINIDNFSPIAGITPVNVEGAVIDRSAIQPSNSNSLSIVDACLENVICKPKEVLSNEALETRKRINSKFAISENLSDLHNALHYVHATLSELENAVQSIRLEEVDHNIKMIKEDVYATAYVCIVTAMVLQSGQSCEFQRIKKTLEKISEFRILFTLGSVETILLARFKQKDREVRVKGMKEAVLRPLDEISKTFQYIHELLFLPSVDLLFVPKEPCLKTEVKHEFISYITCVENIIKIGANPVVHLADGACTLKIVDEFFNISKDLADLKNVNKENLVKYCNCSLNKNIEMMQSILDYRLGNQIVIFYHQVLNNVFASIEIFINKLLLTKFHISEIAFIELSWILEELQGFEEEKTFEKILKSAVLKHPFISNTCFKLTQMSNKMIHLARLINPDNSENLFRMMNSFMASNKTIEIWCSIKTVFNSYKQEIAEVKKSMAECNKELQQIIDQTAFASQEEVDQIKQAIEELKAALSPFLFVIFKLPHTLDEFVIEGKDGLFKKSKEKNINFGTQHNIKDLLNVNFSKKIFPKPLPEPVKIEIPVKITVTPPKQTPIKAEPKVFQTNRLDDILAELKARGWVKDRYHGSHLIFKKEKEIFTVPTNKSRVKDGLLSGLNRQYAEKEEKIHERASK